jgi:hypothetical protein
MFFETLRLREAALTLAGLASVRLALAGLRSQRASRWLAAGLAAGAAVLLKASELGFAVTLPALVAWIERPLASRMLRWAAAFACGIAIAAAPLVARNLAVGIPPFSVAATGPLNFLNGNASDYDPGSGSVMSRQALAIMTATSGRARAVIDATIATHPTTAEWLALLVRKLAVFWRAAEIPNNASWAYFKLQAPWLRYSVSFGVIAPLAVLGLLVGLLRERKASVLALHVACSIAVCVLFYDLARFRLPAAVAMLPFSGCALVWLGERIAARAIIRGVAGAAVVAAAALYVNAPEAAGADVQLRIADYGVHNEITGHLSDARAAAGEPAAALRLLERQIATAPAELRAIEPSARPTRVARKLSAVAGTFAPLYERAARLAASLRRPADAQELGKRAAVLRAINAPYAAAEEGIEPNQVAVPPSRAPTGGP